MKKFLCLFLALGMVFMTAACSQSDETVANTVSGKTYVWEKEGCGGDFTITINQDGTYEYYEGELSSYMGSGDWKVENGILTMNEDPKNGYDFVFRFSVKDGKLRFVSDGSDKFMYVTVEDGDLFTPKES